MFVTVGMNDSCLALSTGIFEQFQSQNEFESGTPGTVGMLFGSVDTSGQSQIHYAPPFLPQKSVNLRQHDYAYGRYEASIEAAYHLRGWTGLGYWLAYEGTLRRPELLWLTLKGSVGGEMPLPDRLLVTLRQTAVHVRSAELRAFASSEPLTGWRELNLTMTSSGNDWYEI